MTAFEVAFGGNGELTTREQVASRVAQSWLAAHPEVEVTTVDLTKTTQQLITELFKTRGRHQREALSEHAVAVLEAAGVGADDFAPVRSFAISADMPPAYGAMIAEVAEVLAPLAAAVQLARIPVADAAARLVHPGEGIDRRQLRGFVVGHLRPHAQHVHARVGAGQSARRYRELIVADVESLAAAVVESARAKNARPNRLDEAAAARMADFARAHLRRLTDYAAASFGQDGDDIIGAALLKIAVQFRNNPGLSAGFAYGRAAVDSVAKDLHIKRRNPHHHEVCDSEVLERAAESTDDAADIDAVDATLRMVLAAAAHLDDSRLGPDASVARQALLGYFLVDPHETDPRRARLADRALHLAPGAQGGGIGAELGEIAGALGCEAAAVDRITALAITALRLQAEERRG